MYKHSTLAIAYPGNLARYCQDRQIVLHCAAKVLSSSSVICSHAHAHTYTHSHTHTHTNLHTQTYTHTHALTVTARVTLPSRQTTVELTVGSEYTMWCAATGRPTPTIRLLQSLSDFPQLSESDNEPRYYHHFKHVTKSDEGVYYCYAANGLVNPPSGKRQQRDLVEIRLIVNSKFTVCVCGCVCVCVGVGVGVCGCVCVCVYMDSPRPITL